MSGSLATPWTVAHQFPLSMGFPRQEYWSGLPFPSPGDLPDPGIEPVSLALAGRFFTTEPPSVILLSEVFWIACCSFHISTCCLTLCLCVTEAASFLQSHEPPSASFTLYFCNFFTPSAFIEPCSGLSFGLKECCGWLVLLSRPLRLSPCQQ